MTLWEDPWSLFIFIYSPSSLSLVSFFVLFLKFLPSCYFGRLFFLIRDTLQEDWKMDQAGILRKFIQGVKAMSEGDEERGEDNFGSDFMVGQNSQQLTYPLLPYIYLNQPFITSTFSSILTPLPVSWYPPGGEAGAATLPSSFSSHFQALHGGLALSPKPQTHHRLLFL